MLASFNVDKLSGVGSLVEPVSLQETKPYIDKSIKQRWNKTLEIEGIIGRYNE